MAFNLYHQNIEEKTIWIFFLFKLNVLLLRIL